MNAVEIEEAVSALAERPFEGGDTSGHSLEPIGPFSCTDRGDSRRL